VLGKPITGAGATLPTQPAPAVANINLWRPLRHNRRNGFPAPSRFGGFIFVSGKALNPCNSVAGPISTYGV